MTQAENSTTTRSAVIPRAGGRGAAREQRSEERGWFGRISAALLGSFLIALASGVAVSIFAPGASGLDRAFSGGLVLTLVWPASMLWVLFARSGLRAWGRVLLALVPLIALDAFGLMGGLG